MKWFKGITNLKDLHKLYVKLAMANHPDKGGNVEAMKEINIEYRELREKFKSGYSFAADDTENTEKNFDDIDGLQSVLSIIAGLYGLEIELCGRWLWIGGNTKAHKDTLKKAGCRWASKKLKWYWHSEKESKTSSRGRTSIEFIRAKYGSQTINSETFSKTLHLN